VSIDNTVETLRDLLFTQIRRLNSADLKELPVEIQRSNAMAHQAQTIINTLSVECEFMRLTGSKGSGFIPITENPLLTGTPRLVGGLKK